LEVDLNRNFSKEDMQMATVQEKKHSMTVITGEMRIKTAVHHLTPETMAIIRRTGAVEDVEQGECLGTVGGTYPKSHS
jgi:hypothetical protein